MVMGSISLLASLFDSTGRLQHQIAVLWAQIVLRVCRIRVGVSGSENLAPGRSYVFCCNHLSLVDTPVMFGNMPHEFRILARQDLWRIPFLGWHLNRAGHIPVPRGSPLAAARNVRKAAEKLRKGCSILMFPEGERTRQPSMLRFRPGAAHIAIKAEAPIVPMALVGTQEILPLGSMHLRPGNVELRVGKPISTIGLSRQDANHLIEEVRTAVGRLIETRSKQ